MDKLLAQMMKGGGPSPDMIQKMMSGGMGGLAEAMGGMGGMPGMGEGDAPMDGLSAAADLGLDPELVAGGMPPDMDMPDLMADGTATTIGTGSVASGGAGGPGASSASASSGPRTLTKEDLSHFICLYPCYFDPLRKISQGRRLPIELVKDAPQPDHLDVAEACVELGFKTVAIDGKRHPRDQWPGIPRVRVELKTKKGELIVPAIPTKEALLKAIAKQIPSLPGRKHRQEMAALQRAQFEKMRAEHAAAAAKASKKGPAATAGGAGATSSAGASGGKGKGAAAATGKGRKGR